MTHLDLYKEPSLAILETIYRGLHAALIRDAALKDSLVLFLPYYITYAGASYQVKLIHPDRLGLKPEREDAKKFFADNKAIIEKAISQGRGDSSLAHLSVAKINATPLPGRAWIDEEYSGRTQYRVLIAQSGSGASSSSGEEYDVTGSCPHLYPALGVLCQFDGKAIGMVSMDFDDQLCEKIEAAFNSFMEPYSKMSLWQELAAVSLRDYFLTATMPGSWCDAAPERTDVSHNGFQDEAALARAYKEFERKLIPEDWDRLLTVLKAAGTDENRSLRHNILKPLQGAHQISPALWVALGGGASSSISETHFTLKLILNDKDVSSATLRDVSISVGDLHLQWQWSDCEYVKPWVVLKGKSDGPPLKVAADLRREISPGRHGFALALNKLAKAVATAWPDNFVSETELRAIASDLTCSEILDTCFGNTSVAVLLGGSNDMFVAVRGNWTKAAF